MFNSLRNRAKNYFLSLTSERNEIKKKEIEVRENITKNHPYKKIENNDDLLVSIIITNRNGMGILPTLFRSLSNKKYYSNIEIIFVDNNSKDKSIQFVKGYSKKFNIHIIKNKKNETFSRSNNIGAKRAHGQFLLFLNNDVEVTDYWLDNMLAAYYDTPKCGAVGAKLIYPRIPSRSINKGNDFSLQHAGIDFKNKTLNGKKIYRPFNVGKGANAFDDCYNTRKECMAVTAACMMVSKKAFFEVGGFDEDYNYGYEDVDLSLKLFKHKYVNIYEPHAILFHYEFGTQSKDNDKIVKERRLSNATVFQQKWTQYLESIIENKSIVKDPQKIAILIAAPDEEQAKTWGDYYYAISLSESFKKRGIECEIRCRDKWYNQFDGKYVLNLRGIKKYIVDNSNINIMWNISHPRDINITEYNNYDYVYIASTLWCKKISNESCTKVKTLLQSIDLSKYTNIKKLTETTDLLFVGINRGKIRQIISDVLPTYHSLEIYGQGWSGHVDSKYIRGNWLDNNDLPAHYSSTKILLNDHWKDMKECGFINNRVFEGLASGTLVISDYVEGIIDIFGNSVITYTDRDDLRKKIDYFIEDEELRKKLIEEGRTIVLTNHSFDNRVETILKDIQS